jgi:tRNA U38,U39,U40 pseudouridine synthase TruA
MQAMRDAARRLEGEHDYRNFCKMDINNGVTNYTRRIMSFTVDPKPGVRCVRRSLKRFRPETMMATTSPPNEKRV